jgi:hypothetical protein
LRLHTCKNGLASKTSAALGRRTKKPAADLFRQRGGNQANESHGD